MSGVSLLWVACYKAASDARTISAILGPFAMTIYAGRPEHD
jgi:hypothetical protein